MQPILAETETIVAQRDGAHVRDPAPAPPHGNGPQAKTCCLSVAHGSAFSRVGASGKPGAVQCAIAPSCAFGRSAFAWRLRETRLSIRKRSFFPVEASYHRVHEMTGDKTIQKRLSRRRPSSSVGSPRSISSSCFGESKTYAGISESAERSAACRSSQARIRLKRSSRNPSAPASLEVDAQERTECQRSFRRPQMTGSLLLSSLHTHDVRVRR